MYLSMQANRLTSEDSSKQRQSGQTPDHHRVVRLHVLVSDRLAGAAGFSGLSCSCGGQCDPGDLGASHEFSFEPFPVHCQHAAGTSAACERETIAASPDQVQRRHLKPTDVSKFSHCSAYCSGSELIT